MKKPLLYFQVICLSVLSYCEFQASIHVAVSQLKQLSSDNAGASLETRARLRLEVGSRESCDEKKEQMLAILSRHYGGIGASSCVDEDLKNYLQADVPIRLVNESDKEKRITSILVSPKANGVRLSVAMDRGRFEAMQQEMEQAFYQKPEVEDLSITIVLYNDAKDRPVLTTARLAYVDGKPIPEPTDIVLESGKKMEITLANVSRDFIFANGALPILEVRPEDQNQSFAQIQFSPTSEVKMTPASKADPSSENPRKADAEKATLEKEPAKENDNTADVQVRPRDFNTLEEKVRELTNSETGVGGN